MVDTEILVQIVTGSAVDAGADVTVGSGRQSCASNRVDRLRKADFGGDTYTVTVSDGQGFQLGSGNAQRDTFRSPPA